MEHKINTGVTAERLTEALDNFSKYVREHSVTAEHLVKATQAPGRRQKKVIRANKKARPR